MDRKEFINAKRIVFKFGTNILRGDDGFVSLPRVFSFIEDLSHLARMGKEVIVVTSGAVGLGKKRLGIESTEGVALKQACAAIGQGKLMSIYESGFDTYGLIASQILLTEDDFSLRQRYLSLRTTLNKLLELGVIPIINQNDTVSTVEVHPHYEHMQVCFSDNDKLSALVASELDADLLVILSDVEGLYTANPQTHPEAKLISQIEEITPEVEAVAGGAGSSVGTGGMFTKLQAAKNATSSGINMVIASGSEKDVIARILNGEEIGTLFASKENRLQFRKRWLAFGARIMGKIIVDDGCVKAIKKAGGCSILPAGISGVEGDFEAGNTVSVVTQDGFELARGLCHYSSDELQKIKGCKTYHIEKILGHKNFDEVIHRDDLVILN